MGGGGQALRSASVAWWYPAHFTSFDLAATLADTQHYTTPAALPPTA